MKQSSQQEEAESRGQESEGMPSEMYPESATDAYRGILGV